MNYESALNLIIQKQSLGIMPGLSRIEKLLDFMENPQKNLKIIHIAGTNGKGTVSNAIALALQAAGYKTGLFTSPWVTNYREQIQINGDYISKTDFSFYIDKYRNCDATEFELLTAVMYKYFFDCGVDYAVVECGMGGLEDSTNAIPAPELAVITSVSFDHTSFLGDALDEIATHKAGVIKQGCKAVLYPNDLTAHIFEEKCKAVSAKLYKVEQQNDFSLNNLETVNTALTLLGVDRVKALPLLPARQEYITDSLMLDGAHNADGARALSARLPEKNITAVIGMMRDKDVDAYLSIIAPLCSKIIATTPSNSRALSADDLKSIAGKYCADAVAVADPLEAIKMLDGEFNLICGSFYLARDVRKELTK